MKSDWDLVLKDFVLILLSFIDFPIPELLQCTEFSWSENVQIVTNKTFCCYQDLSSLTTARIYLLLNVFAALMSSLRFCGALALARKPLLSQTRNVQQLVPVVFKIRELTNLHVRYQQHREFKNFGHKPTPIPTPTRFFHLLVGGGLLACFLILMIDWKGWYWELWSLKITW